jgi:hypothetical protein
MTAGSLGGFRSLGARAQLVEEGLQARHEEPGNRGDAAWHIEFILWKRIRAAKYTGLRNLPSLQGFDQNRIWWEIVAMASELLAWIQMLTLDGPARRWEPKRLRLRIAAT